MKTSAGIVAYRFAPDLQVLAGHPGGPFWAGKHEGVWSIVKGEIEQGEDPETAARREFAEETGVEAPAALVPLGEITQKAGKRVIGFAGELDVDAGTLTSNHIHIEWPPRSGSLVEIPEIDRFAWFGLDEARVALNPAQWPLIERLVDLLAEAGAE